MMLKMSSMLFQLFPYAYAHNFNAHLAHEAVVTSCSGDFSFRLTCESSRDRSELFMFHLSPLYHVFLRYSPY